ncbi:MAG: hypothetical protein C4530_04870 [Desulfobacteraceae bacterium]|nr:MAG: hypothetical protein C4530_04870 [Desulfobacteraceae bacterium]
MARFSIDSSHHLLLKILFLTILRTRASRCRALELDAVGNAVHSGTCGLLSNDTGSEFFIVIRGVPEKQRKLFAGRQFRIQFRIDKSGKLE